MGKADGKNELRVNGVWPECQKDGASLLKGRNRGGTADLWKMTMNLIWDIRRIRGARKKIHPEDKISPRAHWGKQSGGRRRRSPPCL